MIRQRCSKQRNKRGKRQSTAALQNVAVIATARGFFACVVECGGAPPFFDGIAVRQTVHVLTCGSVLPQDRRLTTPPLMNSNTARNFVLRNLLLCVATIAITSCGTATFSKTGSDAQI